MPELITSFEQAQENARRFNKLKANPKIEVHAYKRFARFQHWYYFPGLDAFAPSKFIGYQKTTLNAYQGAGDGGDTETRLTRWFVKINSEHPQFEILKIKLEDYAETLGRKLRKGLFYDDNKQGAIHIPKSEFWTTELKAETKKNYYPDEVNENVTYPEGAVAQVLVNKYERNPQARKECIEKYGAVCSVCEFDFSKVYGELGEGFIHVHHIRNIANIGEEYQVDPIEDLRPLCPNCHAMVHRETPAMHPDKLKEIIETQRKQQKT